MQHRTGAGERGATGDALVPLFLVSIVSTIVLPLPAMLLDALLLCNITLSLILLLCAVNVREPERFTVMPALLLLATLFRLALNISTTRQILGSGSAPDLVVAFGEFAVGGNAIVGAVMFGIISIVQFIVIAKGAERVAEVAARFTLDAMPGRQMAIDADVRAGIISSAEAKGRRFDLQRESKLYGALDGSMKFVKGDAVAGLLITVINSVVGTALGVFSYGLGAEESLQRFLLFAVGDGLVSQLPALFVAVAAGITVTRVSDREGTRFGADVVRQLTTEPRSLAIAAASVGALAIVPGTPVLPCVLLGALLSPVAVRRARADRVASASPRQVFVPRITSALVVRIDGQTLDALRREGRLLLSLDQIRGAIFRDRGVLVPEPSFEVNAAPTGSGEAGEVSLAFHGVTLCRSTLRRPDDASSAVARMLDETLRRQLAELLDDTMTRTLLELHHAVAEDIIVNTVPRLITVTELTVVLRELVKEEVSIFPLSRILQALGELSARTLTEGGSEHGVGALRNVKALRQAIAAVRRALAPEIVSSLTETGRRAVDGRPESPFGVWGLSDEIEELLAVVGGAEDDVPLMPEIEERISAGLAVVATRGSSNRRPVVVVSSAGRPIVAAIAIERRLRLTVLAYDELPPDLPVEVVGVVPCEAAASDYAGTEGDAEIDRIAGVEAIDLEEAG